MEITIQSLHFTARPELTKFIKEKVSKLTHLHDKIITADVYLKLDKSNKTDNKVCEIKLNLPGKDLFAKRKFQTFEEATNEVIDALQQQIKKLKE
ncbi:MAG TPA: ribosome-associated translation inhibitor RaiA [Flavobacteriales bacterium]|nr:ribosome-associated translation inhibitor RaiA [Flavobacteriales bacterium]